MTPTVPQTPPTISFLCPLPPPGPPHLAVTLCSLPLYNGPTPTGKGTCTHIAQHVHAFPIRLAARKTINRSAGKLSAGLTSARLPPSPSIGVMHTTILIAGPANPQAAGRPANHMETYHAAGSKGVSLKEEMASSRTGPACSHWLLGADAPATNTLPAFAAAATLNRIPFGVVNSYLKAQSFLLQI